MAAGWLLLTALAAGVVGQGGFFTGNQRMIAALLAAALLTALLASRPTMADLRLPPVAAATALAGWALIDGRLSGRPASAFGDVLLLVGIAVVLLVCRRLDTQARQLLLNGVLALGLLAAASGWVGVVWRLSPWALPDQGLWRATSTLTYANATAALLVPLALLSLARLARRPGCLVSTLVTTGLLAGAGATASRAGGLSLTVGLVLLGALLGIRQVVRILAGPIVGASIVVVGLLPSIPVAAPSRPLLAVIGLVCGLAVAAVLRHLPVPELAAAALLLAGGLGVSRGPELLAGPTHIVGAARFSAVSSDRARATGTALRLLLRRPLTGTGPGKAALTWTDPAGRRWVGRYVHDEYLQVAVELGIVGALLLAGLLGALAWQAWNHRTPIMSPTVRAGVLAALASLAVHSGMDFVWHLPVLPLTAAVLVGVLLPPPTSFPAMAPTRPNRKEESRCDCTPTPAPGS